VPTRSSAIPDPLPELAPDLARRIEAVIVRGEAAWDELHDSSNERYHDLVLSDHRAAIPWLRSLHTPGARLVELGAGVGLMTILADLLGYEAVGIEIEPELVETARELAAGAGSNATFIAGSFVPPDAREDVDFMVAGSFTVTDGLDAWDELGMDMDDFDVVSCYPWPDEEEWLLDLVAKHAAPHATLLTYSGRNGYRAEPLT
jgi:hypothetical protein